jgi:transposase InsO family protein
MKRMGLRCVHCKKYRPQSSKNKVPEGKLNILSQNFMASRPNEKWLTDITYIYTKKDGWTYLALIIDLFSRLIVGYAYSLNMDSELVVDAANMAIKRRGAPFELIIHTDLGSQYTSDDFEGLFNGVQVRHSYSKKGCPYDNSPMESFNATLKKEEVYTTIYPDFDTARLSIFEYIEGYYNRNRMHSSLNYETPHDFEEAYLHTR